jgi:hypothetical protein
VKALESWESMFWERDCAFSIAIKLASMLFWRAMIRRSMASIWVWIDLVSLVMVEDAVLNSPGSLVELLKALDSHPESRTATPWLATGK